MTARLHRPGLFNFDPKATSELKVLGKIQDTAFATPVLVGPETQTVRTSCCCNSGTSVAAMAISYDHMFPIMFT